MQFEGIPASFLQRSDIAADCCCQIGRCQSLVVLFVAKSSLTSLPHTRDMLFLLANCGQVTLKK